MVLLTIIAAVAAGSYLSARVSEDFACGLSRVAAALYGFFEYKTALRCARSAGTRRALQAVSG
ncbi:MAG TPA: hypothetical protein VM095_04360 [Pyrinomonadaceae bacterium]|nr:hypothetical protein [Pyrinomonadaceae bacterium]